MNKNKEEKELAFKKAKINDKNGLNVSYDKKELEKYMPNLVSEISKKESSLPIDSIDNQIEEVVKKKVQVSPSKLPKELINPGAIDFLRRCTTKEEAFEILDFLSKRNELSTHDYNELKKRISQKGGLKKIIEESGGFKKPGYYERKYYKKEFDKLKLK